MIEINPLLRTNVWIRAGLKISALMQTVHMANEKAKIEALGNANVPPAVREQFAGI